MLGPLAGGFAARVLTGPKLSPLGQLATKVVVPRLPGPPRPVPGAPKRLAQAMGLTMSVASALLAARGRRRGSRRVLAMLTTAAGLEAFAGICIACRMFPLLVRAGLASSDNCPDCANPWARLSRRSHDHQVGPSGQAASLLHPAERTAG